MLRVLIITDHLDSIKLNSKQDIVWHYESELEDRLSHFNCILLQFIGTLTKSQIAQGNSYAKYFNTKTNFFANYLSFFALDTAVLYCILILLHNEQPIVFSSLFKQ